MGLKKNTVSVNNSKTSLVSTLLSPMVFWLKEGNKFLFETFHIVTFILLNFALNKSFSLILAKFLVIDTSNNVSVTVIY